MDNFWSEPLIDLPYLIDIAAVCGAFLVLLVVINLVALNRRRQPLKIHLGGWFLNLLFAVPVGYMLYVVGMLSQPALEERSSEPPVTDSGWISTLAEEIPARPSLPDWTSASPVKHAETVTVVVRTGRFVTKAEAEADLVEKATPILMHEFHSHNPGRGTWTIPEDIILKEAVTRKHWRTTEEDFGATIGKRDMHQLYAQLELTPAVRDSLRPHWRHGVVISRLEIIGVLLSVVMVLLCGVTGYLRLDDLTNGDCRFRLKLASVCFMVAGLFAVAWWVKTRAV